MLGPFELIIFVLMLLGGVAAVVWLIAHSKHTQRRDG
jgi:hypothetical protein